MTSEEKPLTERLNRAGQTRDPAIIAPKAARARCVRREAYTYTYIRTRVKRTHTYTHALTLRAMRGRSAEILMLAALCGLLALGSVIEPAAAEDCKACMQLTSYTFDKVVPKFPAVLVKFDVAFPYGDKHDEYGKFAQITKDAPDLIVAEVGVKDFGSKDNSELAERYDIKKDDYPVVLLFLQGKTEPEKFVAEKDEDFTSDNIKKFVKKRTNIYLGLPGCVEKLDKLAEEFKAASNEKERQGILNKAKVFEETLPEAHRVAAKVYVKTMEKILEKGDVFVQTEQTRLDGLLKGKMSNEKKRSMEERRNILQSFSARDEL